MLSDFAEKKETCLDYKKSKKSAFPKGVNPYFWSKTANFLFLRRFSENET